MELKLARLHLKPEYTIGDLFIDGKYFCNVLEDTVRDINKDGDLDDPGESKIYGQTAIPYGTYSIEMKHSPSFKRTMPYLKNVPGFTSVMIHWGNTDKDTLGCLLVGKNTEKGKVTQSVATFNALWEIIKNEKDLTIKIE